MIFHENRLLVDDPHEISYLIFLKIRKNVAKFVVCFSRDRRLKTQTFASCQTNITLSSPSLPPIKGKKQGNTPNSILFSYLQVLA